MNKMNKYFDLIVKQRFIEADAYKKSIIPKKLYKFFSLSDVENNELKFKTLEEEKLWFSHVSQLNDPYEFKGIYLNRKEFEKRNCTEAVINVCEKIVTHYQDHYVLVSLSENDYNHIPMWAYYTKNYRGFCVEYEVLDSKGIFPILYESEKIPTASIIHNYIIKFSGRSFDEIWSDPDSRLYFEILNQQFYIKHASWENENEYRIIRPHCDLKTFGCNVSIIDIGLKTNKIVAGINCSNESLTRLSDISHSLGCGAVQQCTISNDKYIFLEDK